MAALLGGYNGGNASRNCRGRLVILAEFLSIGLVLLLPHCIVTFRHSSNAQRQGRLFFSSSEVGGFQCVPFCETLVAVGGVRVVWSFENYIARFELLLCLKLMLVWRSRCDGLRPRKDEQISIVSPNLFEMGFLFQLRLGGRKPTTENCLHDTQSFYHFFFLFITKYLWGLQNYHIAFFLFFFFMSFMVLINMRAQK